MPRPNSSWDYLHISGILATSPLHVSDTLATSLLHVSGILVTTPGNPRIHGFLTRYKYPDGKKEKVRAKNYSTTTTLFYFPISFDRSLF